MGLGRIEESRQLAAERLAFLETVPDFQAEPEVQEIRVGLLSLAGRPDEAITLGRAIVQGISNPDEMDSRTHAQAALAEVLADNGRAAESVALLSSLLRRPSLVTIPFLRLAPEFDPIRGDPAFQALLADPANLGPLPDAALAGPPL